MLLQRIFKIYYNAFSGLSRENWLLSGVMLINRMGTMAAVFMSVYVTQSLHRTVSDAGLVLALFGAGAVVGSLSGGFLVKNLGFRFTQISTSIVTGILYLIFSQAENFHWVCVLAVAIGLVSEAFRPANFTAIANYSKPEMITKSYSLNRFAINLGMGLGTGLGGIIASISYDLLFVVEGITNILVGLLILILLPKTGKIQAAREKIKKKKKTSASKSPWRDAKYLRFMLLTVFYVSSFLVLFRFAPLFWKQEKNISESVIGAIIGLNGMIIAILEMVLVQRLQRRNRDMYYIFAGILFAALSYGCLLLPFLPVATAILAILFITLSEMFALPFINTFVVSSSDADNRGAYAAVYTMVWSVSGIAAPSGGAFIAEMLGYNWLWIILVMTCVLCALVLKFIFIGKKKSIEFNT